MIELHKLAAGYPERRVLERVSLQFPDGQITVLAGPNASGKTALLRTILGLEPRLEGEVFLDGTAQTDLTARELALRVSYLPQSRPVPNITAGRMVLHGRFPYLGYPRRYRPEDWAMAKAALREAGAEELERQLMSRLSGGQRQRVYLAMLLAQEQIPPTWMWPTSSGCWTAPGGWRTRAGRWCWCCMTCVWLCGGRTSLRCWTAAGCKWRTARSGSLPPASWTGSLR